MPGCNLEMEKGKINCQKRLFLDSCKLTCWFRNATFKTKSKESERFSSLKALVRV